MYLSTLYCSNEITLKLNIELNKPHCFQIL